MDSAPPTDSALAGIARLTWMTAGNVVLIVLGLAIAIQPPWTFSWRDGVFALSMIAVLVVRYLDITRLAGRTAEGDPATMSHFWRWAAGLVGIAGVVWLLGQSFAL